MTWSPILAVHNSVQAFLSPLSTLCSDVPMHDSSFFQEHYTLTSFFIYKVENLVVPAIIFLCCRLIAGFNLALTLLKFHLKWLLVLIISLLNIWLSLKSLGSFAWQLFSVTCLSIYSAYLCVQCEAFAKNVNIIRG